MLCMYNLTQHRGIALVRLVFLPLTIHAALRWWNKLPPPLDSRLQLTLVGHLICAKRLSQLLLALRSRML